MKFLFLISLLFAAILISAFKKASPKRLSATILIIQDTTPADAYYNPHHNKITDSSSKINIHSTDKSRHTYNSDNDSADTWLKTDTSSHK